MLLKMFQFWKVIISPTHLISCPHVVKRNIDKVIKFYCCGSKMEEVKNFDVEM